jgi:hypothetical protein
MTEQKLLNKLNTVVSMAQEKIITLLTDIHNEQAVAKARAVFSNYPIVLENIEVQKNEFGKTTQVGGYATSDRIVINQNDIQSIDLNTPYELDKILGTIIHEYAHKFRTSYGNLFEEASASIFAEMCINYSKVKNNEQSNELFNMGTSVDYQKAESQVRGILYVLKQKNMDIGMMVEYILGDENRFKQVCGQIFGSSFDTYFTQANSTSISQQFTNESEKIITQILTDYIKNNQISYKDYWSSGKNIASPTNLYFSGSPVLVQSVVNAGIGAIREDEKDLYRTFEYTSRVNREHSQFIEDEKRTRIRNKLEQSFNLSGKSSDDIYDSLVDICSTYIQHKSSDSEESIIYVEELKKLIPNIEEFSDTFKQLRVARLDSTILDNMDLSSISYSQIYDKMVSLMPKPKTEQSDVGYIVTSDINEVARIHSDPKYSNWRHEFVDGEYRFYSPSYQKFKTITPTEQKEDTYVSLEQLAPLLSESGYMCYGHGTGRTGNSDEVVDSIFNKGLRTKDNSMYFTTIGLSTPTPELIEQYKELGLPEPSIENLKKQFNNWQHQNSKKIIIARIPTEYINQMGDRSDGDGEMFGAFYIQEMQENGKSTNYLNPKFIVGCFDVEKQAVRLNKNFERTLSPETIEKLKAGYKIALEKTKARIDSSSLYVNPNPNIQEEQSVVQSQPSTTSFDSFDFDFDENIEWEDTASIGKSR